LPFAPYVRNDNRRPVLVKLVAMCGPLDMDGRGDENHRPSLAAQERPRHGLTLEKPADDTSAERAK
jgi:hypothetical protein